MKRKLTISAVILLMLMLSVVPASADTTVQQQIDSETWVSDSDFDEDTNVWTINISTDRTVQTVMVSQPPTTVQDGNAQVEQVRVTSSSQTTVEIESPPDRDGVSYVSLSTSEGISEGYHPILQHQVGMDIPEDSIALGVGIGLFTGVAGIGIAYRAKYRNSFNRIEEMN